MRSDVQGRTVPSSLQRYPAWSRLPRWFHWLNVVALLGLSGIGLVLLYGKELALGGEAKLVLKTLHAYLGYLFALNLAVRILWGFVGPFRERWRNILPLGACFRSELVYYLAELRRGRHPLYLGFNPLGRLMVSTLLILLLVQALSGLVLAGTDLYLPPFGRAIAESVALADAPELPVAGSKTYLDPEKYAAMRAWRELVVNTHEIGFYLLWIAIVAHVAAVIVTEVKTKSGLISAMFSGGKVFSDKPRDAD